MLRSKPIIAPWAHELGTNSTSLGTRACLDIHEKQVAASPVQELDFVSFLHDGAIST